MGLDKTQPKGGTIGALPVSDASHMAKCAKCGFARDLVESGPVFVDAWTDFDSCLTFPAASKSLMAAGSCFWPAC